MKVVSVINYKGGVGKTTLTANIAASIAKRGKKVLMIDLDPQASLTFSFVQPDYWSQNIAKDKTIKNWFLLKKNGTDFNNLIVTPTAVQPYINSGLGGKLDLVSSHLALINIDIELASMLGGANLKQNKHNFITTHHRLAEGLTQIPEGCYDIVLIDCPPNFNIVTKNAIVASSHVLIPAKPDYLSTMGIDYLNNSVETLVKEYNEYCAVDDDEDFHYPEIHPSTLGVVFTMVQYYGGQPISTIRPFINQTRQSQIPVFSHQLRENKTAFSDAGQFGVPVSVNTDGARTNLIPEIEDIVTEFLSRL